MNSLSHVSFAFPSSLKGYNECNLEEPLTRRRNGHVKMSRGNGSGEVYDCPFTFEAEARDLIYARLGDLRVQIEHTEYRDGFFARCASQEITFTAGFGKLSCDIHIPDHAPVACWMYQREQFKAFTNTLMLILTLTLVGDKSNRDYVIPRELLDVPDLHPLLFLSCIYARCSFAPTAYFD